MQPQPGRCRAGVTVGDRQAEAQCVRSEAGMQRCRKREGPMLRLGAGTGVLQFERGCAVGYVSHAPGALPPDAMNTVRVIAEVARKLVLTPFPAESSVADPVTKRQQRK